MKAPAAQFYWGDWLRDTQLQMASTIARGVWINALCRMWDAVPRGILSGMPDELARLCGCTPEEFAVFLREAESFGFADIRRPVTTGNALERDGLVTVANRRMVRDEKARQDNANRQARYKQKQRRDGVVTEEKRENNNSSASSSASAKTPPTPKGASEGLFGKGESKTVIAQRVVDLWNSIVTRLPKVEELTEQRQRHILARLKKRSIEELGELFRRLDHSNLRCVGFDWITKSPDNMAKVAEGNYNANGNGNGRPAGPSGPKMPTADEIDERDRLRVAAERR
jgi:hypothetical protein